ncbi:hypothetical protein [Listeria monocytogenes]|uniref:hypothetical protein n=1 Tax=Listeria monocytogenes TaxID=1639 RepID=UPI0008748846|nr:hypothetical protein [Listeria monocytogenes]EHC6230824.1 hypothetical protein [Listeria monocytogenes serotype 1/2a]EAD0720631.1 hypothetical protein [Listeria monocytogenes]EAE7466182.1 hypothetical protein [Listeria monocytogenes]EAF1872997.1 hypothetical protein [Listeria monocytogenes]EAV9833188.1 hypothetical protein [Listeria monocytogenes]
MLVSKSGIVRKTSDYTEMYIEMSGDSDNTDSFYILLGKGKELLLFWDTTEFLVIQQIMIIISKLNG